ncbi:MAG: dienelactone hydrolase family protein [Acidimicrobiales bacterium]
MSATLSDFTRDTFAHAGTTRDIYRRGSGPAVLVLAEIPGITPKVLEFADRVAGIGCTAVVPHLFGDPGREPSGAYATKTMLSLCVSREFSALALHLPGTVVDWLRALAADERRRCGGPGVGVVGMCFTGNYGLAMAVDDNVIAPVLSQPSMPFAVGKKRRSEVGLSDEELSKVKQRVTDEGLCVLGLRFTGDRLVPAERFARLRKELGDGFIAVELDSSPGNPHGHPKVAHSVLTEHLQDREGTPTRAALDQVLDFLRQRLLPA